MKQDAAILKFELQEEAVFPGLRKRDMEKKKTRSAPRTITKGCQVQGLPADFLPGCDASEGLANQVLPGERTLAILGSL